MSKAVLISIRPKWCELIATGDKTVEVRKTRPKLETPFRCYIYCTKTEDMLWVLNMTSRADYGGLPAVCANLKHAKGASRGNGKVIGEFVCDFILTDNTFGHDALFNGEACMSEVDAAAYSLGKPMYGWRITNLRIYDRPVGIGEFIKCDPPSIDDLDEEICCYCDRTNYGERKSGTTPNGYWACEGQWCEDAYWNYLYSEHHITRPPQSWCYVEDLGDKIANKEET